MKASNLCNRQHWLAIENQRNRRGISRLSESALGQYPASSANIWTGDMQRAFEIPAVRRQAKRHILPAGSEQDPEFLMEFATHI